MEKFLLWIESGRFEERVEAMIDRMETPSAIIAMLATLVVTIMACEMLMRM
ncbi:MAG TPA: hypothetical protein P5244_07930 [Syntrophales bacterium]|nr:hypothetical protein [Syntrophales bacterium]